jgi:hypothetical protein
MQEMTCSPQTGHRPSQLEAHHRYFQKWSVTASPHRRGLWYEFICSQSSLGLWWSDIRQWQVGEEKVHGGVKVGVTPDGQDAEQVLNHCDHVYKQEQSKQDELQFWIFSESHEMKFWNVLYFVLWYCFDTYDYEKETNRHCHFVYILNSSY